MPKPAPRWNLIPSAHGRTDTPPGRPASWFAVASGHIHQIWTAAAVLDLEHTTAQIRG